VAFTGRSDYAHLTENKPKDAAKALSQALQAKETREVNTILSFHE